MTSERTAVGTRAERRTVTIVNSRGLHARAAAKFVKLAAEFQAEVEVAKDRTRVAGSSIMGLMMLAAGPGTRLEISAAGSDAAAALEALAALVERKFDEDKE
jgi:phosphocarrier protein HPr